MYWLESSFLAKVFSKSCTGLNPILNNWLVINAGLRALGFETMSLYSELVVLEGNVPVTVKGLNGFASPRSIRPTISLASVVVPFLLVTQTSMRKICTCVTTAGNVLIAWL